MTNATERCCPKFEAAPWDEQLITWEGKRFVKDRVRSVFHIPLNFGSVMVKNCALIKAADATPDEMLVLADENSLWGADVYIAVARDVPQARMATLSGSFLCKVFEGPYKDVRKWITQMSEYVSSQSKSMERLYFFYTTCPKCAKAYGKNYVVLLAKVG